MTSTIALTKQPHFVVGAGDLISHVHRQEAFSDAHYRFNLFRIEPNGEATSWFRPDDLRDVVKACQVLAFSIADDGWIEQPLREKLIDLANELQFITDSWSQQDAEI